MRVYSFENVKGSNALQFGRAVVPELCKRTVDGGRNIFIVNTDSSDSGNVLKEMVHDLAMRLSSLGEHSRS